MSSRPVCATKRVEVQCPVVETLSDIRKALGSIFSTGKKKREEREESRTLENTSGTRGPKLSLFLAIPTTPPAALALSRGGPDTSYGCFPEWAGLQSMYTAIGSKRRHSPLVSANLPIDKEPAP